MQDGGRMMKPMRRALCPPPLPPQPPTHLVLVELQLLAIQQHASQLRVKNKEQRQQREPTNVLYT